MPKGIGQVNHKRKRPGQGAHLLKMARIDKGLTQEELASMAGVARMSVVLVEGDSTSGLRVAPKLWQALNDYTPEDYEEDPENNS